MADLSSWLPLPLPAYREPFEQHLLLGVSVFCIVILVVCLLCYVSITK